MDIPFRCLVKHLKINSSQSNLLHFLGHGSTIILSLGQKCKSPSWVLIFLGQSTEAQSLLPSKCVWLWRFSLSPSLHTSETVMTAHLNPCKNGLHLLSSRSYSLIRWSLRCNSDHAPSLFQSLQRLSKKTIQAPYYMNGKKQERGKRQHIQTFWGGGYWGRLIKELFTKVWVEYKEITTNRPFIPSWQGRETVSLPGQKGPGK